MSRTTIMVVALSALTFFTMASCSNDEPMDEAQSVSPKQLGDVGVDDDTVDVDDHPIEVDDHSDERQRKNLQLIKGTATNVHSKYLDGTLLVQPGVFVPTEANALVLPFMQENGELFVGKTVLEIGTGTGIISVYAAKLGAEKVISTDISEMAVANASRNAKRFGVASVMETRLVPQTDISAYSVIDPDEAFDIIISNPPYSLDLDADENTAVTDRGDLGFSIVRGLESHLKPGGVVMLLYGSLFYHNVMVKFARHMGYEVRNHVPFFLSFLEAETLFNFYLSRLLELEQIGSSDFRFDFRKDDSLRRIRVFKGNKQRPPLLPGNSARQFPGMMVIQRKQTGDRP